MTGPFPTRASGERAADPRVSVIITACGDSPALRSCLERIAKQERPWPVEVLLVVNAAPEALPGESRAVLAALCDRLLFEPRVGKSNALNSAVGAARGEVIAFTDDDAEPVAGWLEAIVRPLLADDRDPRLVGTGGPVEPGFPPSAPDWYTALVRKKTTHFLGPRHELGDEPRDYVDDGTGRTGVPLGANCAYRREVFADYRFDPTLGPNRETGLRGGEDTLIGRLLLRDGYRLRYCPDARVRHPVEEARITEQYVVRGYYMQGVEMVRLHRLLGRELDPVEELRGRLRRLRLRQLRKWLSFPDRDRRRHIRIKASQLRGQIDETVRGASATPVPPAGPGAAEG